jgi:hypothetical protein
MNLNRFRLFLRPVLVSLILDEAAHSQSPDVFTEPSANHRDVANVQRAASMRFHAMARQGCGLLIPL